MRIEESASGVDVGGSVAKGVTSGVSPGGWFVAVLVGKAISGRGVFVAVAVAGGMEVGFLFPLSLFSSPDGGGQSGPPACPQGISAVGGHGITPPAASVQIGSCAWTDICGIEINAPARKNAMNMNKDIFFIMNLLDYLSSLFSHVQSHLSVGITLPFSPTLIPEMVNVCACYTECNFSNPAVLFNQTPPVRF